MAADSFTRVEEICEQIDAMVYSGDALYTTESLSAFETYLEAWSREVILIKNILADWKKEAESNGEKI